MADSKEGPEMKQKSPDFCPVTEKGVFVLSSSLRGQALMHT